MMLKILDVQKRSLFCSYLFFTNRTSELHAPMSICSSSIMRTASLYRVLSLVTGRSGLGAVHVTAVIKEIAVRTLRAQITFKRFDLRP